MYIWEIYLIVHPSRDAIASKPGGETETLRAHGEVTDEIPD